MSGGSLNRRRGSRLGLLAVALWLAGALVGGCSALRVDGGSAPAPAAPAAGAPSAAAPGRGGVAARVAQAQRTHEYPGPPVRQTAGPGAVSPVAAVQEFATAYVNWTAATVAGTMRALAAASVGQARSETALIAGETDQDYELRHGGIANVGTVEAIAPLAGRSHQYAVVTRERTTATASNAYDGLRPAWHVTLATVTELNRGRWVLSAWQPEN